MSFSSKRFVVVAGGTLALVAAAPSARAEQFTFFDFTYEATTANTHDAHYDVRTGLTQPNSWKTPIDYTAGTIYIEQEVMTKPSKEPTQVDVCFLTGGYGCLNTKLYTDTGRNTTTAPVKDFWQFGNINWNSKIPLVQLIVKDKNNANGGRPVTSFMPTKMRIAVTVVSAGATYVPPMGFASAAPADAGAADAGAGEGDAGGTTGTGGTPGGSGGAAGSGAGEGTGGAPASTGGTSGSTGGSAGASTGTGGVGTGSGTGGSSSDNGDKTGGSSGGSSSGTGGSSGSSSGAGESPAVSAACSYGGTQPGGSAGVLAALALLVGALVTRRRR